MTSNAEILAIEKQKGKGYKKKLKELIKSSTKNFSKERIWKEVTFKSKDQTSYITLPHHILFNKRRLYIFLIFEGDRQKISTNDPVKINEIKERKFKNKIIGIKLKDLSKNKKMRLSNSTLNMIAEPIWEKYDRQYRQYVRGKNLKRQMEREQKEKEKFAKEQAELKRLRKLRNENPKRCKAKRRASMFDPVDNICNNPDNKKGYKKLCSQELKYNWDYKNFEEKIYWELPQNCPYFVGYSSIEIIEIEKQADEARKRFISGIMRAGKK